MRGRYLPKHLNIIGYARSDMTDEALRGRVKKFLKGDEKSIDDFLSRLTYCPGGATVPGAGGPTAKRLCPPRFAGYEPRTGFRHLQRRLQLGNVSATGCVRRLTRATPLS